MLIDANMITFDFDGTSHGEGYCGKIFGLPSGFAVDLTSLQHQLDERKKGYGRSARQFACDRVEFPHGSVTDNDGTLEFFVPNVHTGTLPEITALRSGHADVTGKARFPEKSVRQIAEIASARSSVCYVILGAICKQILAKHNIFTYHYVEKIGGISARNRYRFGISEKEPHFAILHCPCRYATDLMTKKIDEARNVGNSLGGVVAVGANGVPMGIGEILPYSERLDAQISANLLGIPSVKGIVFGDAEKIVDLDGVSANDALEAIDGKICYAQNKCGGIVGGISNGRDILCHLFVKPIPTVEGVETIDSATLQVVSAHHERADTCVVPNVGVIAENILAYVLLNQLTKQR